MEPRSDLVTAWQDSVSAYLDWQVVVCRCHRSPASHASKEEQAQAFGRLILLQAMQRLSEAYRASQLSPRPDLPGRLLGLEGDASVLDHVRGIRALKALENAQQQLNDVNDDSTMASQALALLQLVAEEVGGSYPGWSMAPNPQPQTKPA